MLGTGADEQTDRQGSRPNRWTAITVTLTIGKSTAVVIAVAVIIIIIIEIGAAWCATESFLYPYSLRTMGLFHYYVRFASLRTATILRSIESEEQSCDAVATAANGSRKCSLAA